IAKQHPHDTILLGIGIPHAEGEEEGSSATHPFSLPLETRTSRPLTRGARHVLLRLCRASRILCTMSLVSSCTTAASSQMRWECWHVASAIRTRNDRCRGALPAWCRCFVPPDLVCEEVRWVKTQNRHPKPSSPCKSNCKGVKAMPHSIGDCFFSSSSGDGAAYADGLYLSPWVCDLRLSRHAARLADRKSVV